MKGLQEDEVDFLEQVSQREIQINKDRNSEEANIIREMKISLVVFLGLEYLLFNCRFHDYITCRIWKKPLNLRIISNI